MRFIKNKQFSQSESGDTIIEVLISILVVSTVLTGAFLSTSQSLATVHDAQERAQASKIAQSQVEKMRAFNLKSTTTSFCLNDAVTVTAQSTSSNDKKCYFNHDGVFISALPSSYMAPAAGQLKDLYSGPEGIVYKVVASKIPPTNGDTVKVKVSVRWVTMSSKLGSLDVYYRVINE